MSKKIHVLGWYSHNNIGDEVYKIVFPKIFPAYTFKFVDAITDHDYDAVILGGGDVLNDYFLRQLEKTNAPKYALSINVSEKNHDNLSIFKQVYARNFISTTDQKIKTIPDLAFYLSPAPEKGKELIKSIFKKYGGELYKKLVVITMNAYLSPKKSTLSKDHITYDNVCYRLADLMDSTSASFLLLPFGNGMPANDRIANSSVYSKCTFWSKNMIVYNELSVQDTLDICSAADAVISARLHGAIFSCIGGTPFISLNHHDKMNYFTNFIGRPEWSVNYWNFDLNQASDLLNHHLSHIDEARESLLALSNENRNKLIDLPNHISF